MRSALTLKERGEDSSSCGFSPLLFLFCMVKDKCFVMEDLSSGIHEVFKSQSDAAKHIGVSRQYIGKCAKENDVCRGYMVIGDKNRFFLVKTTDKKFEICTVHRKLRKFILVNDNEREIPFRYVESAIDATELCLNGKSENLE